MCIFTGFLAVLAATVAAGVLALSVLRSPEGSTGAAPDSAPQAMDVNFTAYEECAWTAFRLPASVAPVRYDLRLNVAQLAPPSEVSQTLSFRQNLDMIPAKTWVFTLTFTAGAAVRAGAPAAGGQSPTSEPQTPRYLQFLYRLVLHLLNQP